MASAIPDPRIDHTREKQCSRCRRLQPLWAFSLRQDAPDGHNNYCRQCRAAYSRERAAQRRLQRGLPVDPDWNRSIDRNHEKRCSRCRMVKPLGDFTRNRAKSDGHEAYCRNCAAAKQREARRRANSHRQTMP